MRATNNRFPPIGSYGFLSNCHTSALVSFAGAVEWLCLPRFDSPSAFATLLDRGAGHFSLTPRGVFVPISRRYEPGTLIIETTWVTESGWVLVHDALTIAEWAKQSGPGSRPQTEHGSDHSLLRSMTCLDGEVAMEMECLPRFGYGLERAAWNRGEFGEVTAKGADVVLSLTSDMELSLEDGAARGKLNLGKGESGFCALSWGEGDLGGPRSAPEAAERLESTKQFWRDWLRDGNFPDHPWRIHLQRSALVLKGLTYTPTGAILAAPTTSLPEKPGGERNWDYRFSWIRDSTFSLWALHTLGFDQEARDYMRFIVGVCREQPDLQIMYGIGGEKDLGEQTLDHLDGYMDSRPVRIGNGAYDQRQNDVWGALLDSVYLHAKALRRDSGTKADQELIRYQVEAAISAWKHPDQGIWESRGEPQHYVSSKLMIWVAVDRGVRLARRFGFKKVAGGWEETAAEIREEILQRGLRDGVFRQHYDTDALDASLLLIPLLRFLPPDDPRVRATVEAIAKDLTEHGLVLRYRVAETDDGLSDGEGTFLICSFWLVSALSEIGESKRARTLCERLLGAAGWLDLYAEELEADSGRHLGNFPQAFTHLALINAVSHVIADSERADGGPTAVFSEMGGVREEA